ncbi:MAG: hypothetical protein QOD53_2547 [Thermoleophilaceae bacterium]|jgi:hypothetical protein|nr:hypothetical protein [Thermoleophilaceae bacterium]
MDEQRVLDDAATARRFQRRLEEVRPPSDDRYPTVLYDESGYPIDQRPLGLTDRLRRLITG